MGRIPLPPYERGGRSSSFSFDNSDRTHRGKTGTAEEYAAASLFLSRPGGLSVLMGLFSSSGEGMTYVDREGGVTGASLVPYVDELLRSEALEKRADRSFRIRGDLERQLLQKPLLAH